MTSSEALTQKKHRVSRGYTYGYYAAAPSRHDRPTVLLLHGWPDDSTMWFDLAHNHLLPAGYGVVMPDTLGYGMTDKERDPKKYRMELITRDLCDILDAEQLDKVVVAGHDWGSTLAQRVYLYAPQRTIALAIVCVAYIPPSKPGGQNIKLANDIHEKAYGMRCLEYMHFFASDESDAIADAHLEAAFHMCYNADFPKAVVEIFSKAGKPKELLQRDVLLPLHPSVTQQEKKRWIERLRRDSFNGPFNYYRMQLHHAKDGEKTAAGPRVDVPTLYVGYTEDWICRKENILRGQANGLLPKLTNVTLNGTHWGLIQDPTPFGKAFMQWITTNDVEEAVAKSLPRAKLA